MKRVFIILWMIFALSGAISAQTPVNMGSTSSVTGCSFIVYDNGGISGNYGANRNDVLTIYSDNPSAGCVSVALALSNLNIDPTDTLFIYDGPNTSSPMLGMINDAMTTPFATTSIVYTATITNTSGAVTLRFVSDGSGQGNGFMIETDCVAPCQRVQLELDYANCSHVPALESDGFYYINVCSYDTVHLAVRGVYPDNNFSYNQSDATSHFRWDMGLEQIDSLALNALDYHFMPGRGYDVMINATDVGGCMSTMPLAFRVRTSRSPVESFKNPSPVCRGSEMDMTFSYFNDGIIKLDSVFSEQLAILNVSDTIFLPDGVNCGGGCAYQSPVTFNAFAPTATIQSADDILYLRVKIEHSYIGDIYIALTCPNGQSVKIMNKYGTSGSASCAGSIPLPWGWLQTSNVYPAAHFGVIGYANNADYKCDPTQNEIGNTWNYCWSNNTDPSYGYTYAPGGGRVYDMSNIHNGIVDSTNTVNMTHLYHPDQPFSNLIGCPLNGVWAITVLDGWSGDNGYITEWEMALDSSLLPETWYYEVHTTHQEIIGPGAQGTHVHFTDFGLVDYTVRVVDEYGCVYDSVMKVRVLESPIPDLGDDIHLCYGDMVELTVDSVPSYANIYWNTGDTTRTILALAEGEYFVDVSVFNEIDNALCHGYDTIHIISVEAPVMDFDVEPMKGCVPLVMNVQNRTTPPDAQHEWMIFDHQGIVAAASSLAEPQFTILNPGTYTLYYRVTSPYGCVDSVFYWDGVEADMQPVAEFTANPEISLLSESGGVVQFFNYADSSLMNDPDNHVYWDFDDGEVDSSSLSPEHTYGQWGDYDVTLRVVTGAGCASEITHTVVIEQDLVFPNVITPNGDNINDVFAIENLNTNVNLEDPDGFRNNKLFIYDRWGKKVYEAHNYDTFAKNGMVERGAQAFDGTGLSDGVYYYSFYYKGKAKTVNYNGSLTIIR